MLYCIILYCIVLYIVDVDDAMHFIYSHKYNINSAEDNVRAQRYSRKVSTRTGNRTAGLLFNVRALYQLSDPDRIRFCYENSGKFWLPHCRIVCVCVRCVWRAGVVHVCRYTL